jgi:predicted transcriptional regulator
LKKGLSIAPYDRLLYESLAVRQLSNGEIAEGLATLQRGLDLFPEDEVLHDLQDRARARGLAK